jgi:hypothetical protein
MLQNKYFQTKTNQPMTTDNGKRDAFPSDNDRLEHGLSKREYFAAMAMQGILAFSGDEDPDPIREWDYEAFAECSVKAADALLKQLQNE